MQSRTVLLVRSDHCSWPLVRVALTSFHPEVQVVGEAQTIDGAREAAHERHPDVVVAGDRVDGEPTLPLLTELRALPPKSTLIVIGAQFDPSSLPRFAAIGVSGHLVWRDLSEKTLRDSLGAAIRANAVVISREVAAAVLAPPPAPPLSDRERAILRLLVDGHSRKEIVAETGIGLRSVNRAIDLLEDRLDAPTALVLGYKTGSLKLLN